ncbi:MULTISPECIES: hypothetical protein [Alteromonas]|uniref:Transcriptional regulator n=1 Tax=Alteromonas macleodii (strain English Channel 673) TaxID=1004788 RepID=A0AB32ZYB2_ALTME|nr:MULTISPECIES: hypothetical protein [Alteromonas]AFT74490.1 hypothetical protein AMEC673_08980 [Alteromonas macleodii str. 'English Channel 673']MEC8451563.1 hypothetical protein [Pseudomonadota bacterium]MEC9275726.1 hypothetical protein [Pseudomonadota bacterium]NOH56862.1 hypothetical protein [Alteromonas sp. 07-89-2]
MEWFALLLKKVKELGRRQVELDTGMSKTTLSQVLNEKYPGSISNIEKKVLAAYANLTVTCPVLGSIAVKRCLNEQIRPFSASNPQRVRLFRACQNCIHRSKQ